MILIDPTPAGWAYGFPKPFDNPENLSARDWCVKEGYPEDLAKIASYRFIGSYEELKNIE